jgi:uncharacterized protein (DUF433 family)
MEEDPLSHRIVRDQQVWSGKPVIKGTQLLVEHILQALAQGTSVERILAANEGLQREDIEACILFGSRFSQSVDTCIRWFEEWVGRSERGEVQPPRPGKHYHCPCCGYPTLGERRVYEICSLCHWEDDGQDDPHADEMWGGPNGEYSLTEARVNFKRYLTKYDPTRESGRHAKPSPAEAEAKRKWMEVFDVLKAQGNETWSPAQELHIMKLDQTLWKETLWRVQEQLPLP